GRDPGRDGGADPGASARQPLLPLHRGAPASRPARRRLQRLARRMGGGGPDAPGAAGRDRLPALAAPRPAPTGRRGARGPSRRGGDPMSATLEAYAEAAGQDAIQHLRHLARPLRGARVVHVNSTAVGGGVAEILARLIPLKRELGIDATWEIIEGDAEFYAATKGFHNALQGQRVDLPRRLVEHWLEVNRTNAERLRATLAGADFVFIHDPQPAPLFGAIPDRRGRWVWRCHIDVSHPHGPVWKTLRTVVRGYDASVFSMAAFAQPLPHPQYLVPPSIDPLSQKNRPLDPDEAARATAPFGLDPTRPVILQVSRFDRFKDPVGVIRAFRMVRPHVPIQLVLA